MTGARPKASVRSRPTPTGPRATVPYLRVVVTTRCTMACRFCHMEGDPATAGAEGGLPITELVALAQVGLELGVRKVKLLGGEPLARRDLPDLIRALRDIDPVLDISLITAGAVPARRLDACFDAGLSRANMSIHGFSPDAFARNARGESLYRLRGDFLRTLLEAARPTKLNYVYTGPEVAGDLAAFLAWAADKPVVVNVLDDLSNTDLDSRAVEAAVLSLRGEPETRWLEPDPFSLPTLRLRWADGLTVEIKSERLGDQAPWTACNECPARARCREGIHALRLSHDGWLRPCMDRPDRGVDLVGALRDGGLPRAREAWMSLLEEVR